MPLRDVSRASKEVTPSFIAFPNDYILHIMMMRYPQVALVKRLMGFSSGYKLLIVTLRDVSCVSEDAASCFKAFGYEYKLPTMTLNN